MKIHQIYYSSETKEQCDEAFIPYDNSQSKEPEWREYAVFREHYLNNAHKKTKYCGILSWKFNQKTNISGKEFLTFIENNPGYDVYFINPWPDLADVFNNVWQQGEIWHHGLIMKTQKIFDRLGYNIDLSAVRNDERDTLYCNYWVGNADFWERYMEFTLPVYNELKYRLTSSEYHQFHKTDQQASGASVIPYIMERMFSTLLWRDPSIKALGYQYPLSYKYESIVRNTRPLVNHVLNQRKKQNG